VGYDETAMKLNRPPNRLSRWLPLLVGICVAMPCIFLWRAMATNERVNVERTIRSDAERVNNEVAERVRLRSLAFIRMARRWALQGTPDKKLWEDDARLYSEHFPGTQGVTYVDPSYRVRWIIPVKGNESALGLDLGFEKQRLRTMEEARRLREVRITPPIDLVQGGRGIIFFAPIFSGERFDGFIDGVFRTQEFLDSMLKNIVPGYVLSISSEGEEIFRRGEAAASVEKWGRESAITLCGVDWRVRVAPTRGLLEGLRSGVDEALLFFGIALALMFAFTIRFAQNARRRAGDAEAARADLEWEIGRRERAEEDLRRLNAVLELKVEERTRQLLAAQEELVRREKLAVLGQLAESVGNELRNPLGVMNNAVFFLRNLLTGAEETAQEYLEILQGEIDTSRHILTDFIDFFRTRSPRTKAVAVAELIGENTEKFAIPDNIALRLELPDSLPSLSVDPAQMGQVLRNLVSNAIQAMPLGGALNISARLVGAGLVPVRDPKGYPQGLPQRDFVEISVADTGEGIAPENMEKLFQPLFSTKSRGVGLGLPISKNLVEANGGRIQMESLPEKGSTFAVVLPAEGGWHGK
jgi:signal transduction histidine kinase